MFRYAFWPNLGYCMEELFLVHMYTISEVYSIPLKDFKHCSDLPPKANMKQKYQIAG
jgi:hypothetical protein